ncbi:PaaI family thioesterase [Aquihabitans sp. G128]|uniref:PaaI family thioesterase n=1 Tax=Aquihabitans sp. G128 TaxID=2849779 RepID=UPI001C231AFE|nr:PaaI family thioesterase [Aquihabitans sp. G128]QXC60969.1 PaaI family thioesterase [Aquihabitans sp. G128]
MVAMDPDQLNAFLSAAFPGAEHWIQVVRADDDGVELRQPFADGQLRPGGTISGPTLMTLADTVAYVAVVSRIGPEFLTVTSHLAMDFLRKPPPAALRATGELLKLGRRQALVAVRIYSEANDELVAYATSTYALPSTPSVPRADLEEQP